MKKKLLAAIWIFLAVGVFSLALRFVNAGKVQEQAGYTDKGDFKPAPDWTLFDIDGRAKALSDFKGKVVILDFWASWCPPCREEIPHFIELYDEYKDEGLAIIGVSLDSNAEQIMGEFVKSNGINYTILVGNREVSNLYGGIRSIPTTFVIDREGRIREKYIGYRDKEVFEGEIKKLL